MTLRLTFRAITAWPGDTPATPHSQRRRSQFSAKYSATLELLERELNFLDAKNVIVDHRGDRLRIGFGLYQDAADVEALVAHL